MSFFQNTCKPEGLGGKIMVTTMNIGGHAALAKWGLSQLTLEIDSDILEIGSGGANVVMLEEMPARITLAYAECVKQKKRADGG
ncbi:MAG: hypothetical protein LIO70_01740 [Clostridiales bacterium]|nr:hypothetical protein [Clostridiales bacterium]